MATPRWLRALLIVAGWAAPAGGALAQEVPTANEGEGPTSAPPENTEPTREQLPTGRPRNEVREDSQNPFRQSTLVIDQSMTTRTVDFGPTPLSYVPLYELWLSFRPRYSFDEHWSVRGRFDYTKELTNSQATTLYREDVFGDIWTDLVYSTKLDRLWPGTRVNAGLRALWPTSKASQANGTYVTPGVRAAADHRFDLRGAGAPAFNSFHVGLGFTYFHPLTTATTPTSYGTFGYVRQDVDERSFISDEITGQTLPEHIFWIIFDGGLQITPRLSVATEFVVINQWHYAPSNAAVGITGGTVNASMFTASGSDNQFTQSRWLVAQVEYDLFDELSLGLGYYNLTNALAPDGTNRSVFGGENIWWSPEARFFLDVTANLDAIFDDASGHRYSTKQAEAAHRDRPGSELR